MKSIQQTVCLFLIVILFLQSNIQTRKVKVNTKSKSKDTLDNLKEFAKGSLFVLSGHLPKLSLYAILIG